MAWDGTRWRAELDLSQESLPAGAYQVQVVIRGATATASFSVGVTTAGIQGHVLDLDGAPVSQATVRLYRMLDFYAGRLVPIVTTDSGGDGSYAFTAVDAGNYVMTASKEGFSTNFRYCEVVVNNLSGQDLVLSAEDTLAPLLGAMRTLATNIEQAMLAQTSRLPDLSEQAADHFALKIDAWDILSGFANILDGATTMGTDALRQIAQHEGAQSLVAALSMIVMQGLGDMLLGDIVEHIVITESVKDLLPSGTSGWRRLELEEFLEVEAYDKGLASLNESEQGFAFWAPHTVVDERFDFDAARRAISDQQRLAKRLQDHEMVMFYVLPEPDQTLGAVLFPGSEQVWLMDHAALSLYGGAQKTVTVVFVASASVAVASSLTGIGLPVGVAAGTVAAVAGKAKLVLAIGELPLNGLAAFSYGMMLKNWAQDMLVLPVSHSSTAAFLEKEAQAPHYLHEDAQISGTLSVDLHTDLGNIILITLPYVPVAYKTADVTVTNTGNLTSKFSVVANGWWEFKLPGEWPVIGGLFGNVSKAYVPVAMLAAAERDAVELDPGESTVLSLPYWGINPLPANLFSPHWIRLDLYSGPFLVDSETKEYFVARPLGLREGAASLGPEATYLREGQTRGVGPEDFAEMAPKVTLLTEAELSPDDPAVEVEFEADSEQWATAFQLSVPPTAEVSLLVCNALNECVGHDPDRAQVRNEFPANYVGAQGPQQEVELLAEAGESFTVHAILRQISSSDPVPVQLWAIETPVRPAVMAVTPGGFELGLYRGEEARLPVTVAEASQQVPLEDVKLSISELIGPDGAVLPLTSVTTIPLGTLAAGGSRMGEFAVSVPLDAPLGTYTGEIEISSGNAGTQTLPVMVHPHHPGDYNADSDFDLADFAMLQVCVSAEPEEAAALRCDVLDSDADGDVDAVDHAAFVESFNGPQ